jgi:hypothetical protein
MGLIILGSSVRVRPALQSHSELHICTGVARESYWLSRGKTRVSGCGDYLRKPCGRSQAHQFPCWWRPVCTRRDVAFSAQALALVGGTGALTVGGLPVGDCGFRIADPALVGYTTGRLTHGRTSLEVRNAGASAANGLRCSRCGSTSMTAGQHTVQAKIRHNLWVVGSSPTRPTTLFVEVRLIVLSAGGRAFCQRRYVRWNRLRPGGNRPGELAREGPFLRGRLRLSAL